MRPPLLFVALSAVLLGACYSAGDGQAPPLQSLYFPTGVALDVLPNEVTDPSVEPAPAAAPKHLYVASSDFDLQYRASALVSYNLDDDESNGLEGLIAHVPKNCNVDADCPGQQCDNDATASPNPSYFCVDDKSNPTPCASIGPDAVPSTPADQLLYPGRCSSIDQVKSHLIEASVQIGAFASDLVFRKVPDGAALTGAKPNTVGRLFLPVRGDATLHWIDVNGAGELDCGQASTADNSCDDAHRVGDDEDVESPNMLRQEPEPFAIALDDDGLNITVTNQTTGSISLYANQWATDAPPRLVDLLTGLPTAPVGITALPKPRVPAGVPYESGFLAVYRNAAQVDLLRVHVDDDSAAPANAYEPRVLTRAGSVAINANSIGSDSRGIVIDDEQRQADYRACYKPCAGTTGDVQTICLQQLASSCFQAAHQPSVFVSNRAPASVLVGALTPDFSYAAGTSELPAFTDSVPLSVGPSRIVLGKVKVPSPTSLISDENGPYALETRVFIVCFDSRRIYIYDPARRVIDSIVTTGRGPFALAIDEARGYGYVAHFTDSYLGVISLDQRFPKNYAAIIASVGVPSPPRASK
jgi:hypothetical protein